MTKSVYFYRNNGVLQRIDLNEVTMMETAKNYVKFHTKDGFHMVRISMETAMKHLKDKGFVQIHRYYAVALDKIHVIDKENVYFSQNAEDNLPITKSYYANLVSKLKMLGEEEGE
jgi:DNA-binding LytR/AlgR family response regulator